MNSPNNTGPDRPIGVMVGYGNPYSLAEMQLEACLALLEANRAEIAQLRTALKQIATDGERAMAEFGEPRNYVPEFCRAVLGGSMLSFGEFIEGYY